MPKAPPKACACGGKITAGVCDRCGPRKRSNARGFNESKWRYLYKTERWKRESKKFRMRPENQLCAICEREGRRTPTQCVDHVQPHHGDEVLFWDRSNWQPACIPCNTRKGTRG